MKICPMCGSENEDEALFCTNCAAPFNKITGAPEPQPMPGSQPGAQRGPEPDPQRGSQPGPQGAAYGAPQGGPYAYYQQPNAQYYGNYNPFDHTAEYDATDVSNNKVICMLVYLMGIVGIFLAMLAKNSSPYVDFHVRQAMKFVVVETLTGLATIVLCWTIIVPVAAGIFMLVLLVVKIICFTQICSGKAIEPAIIRSIGFLK